jgi:hypothetical protein
MLNQSVITKQHLAMRVHSKRQIILWVTVGLFRQRRAAIQKHFEGEYQVRGGSNEL